MKGFIGIQSKLLVVTLFLAVVPLLSVGMYTLIISERALEERVLNSAAKDVLLREGEIRTFLRGVETDLIFLSKIPPVQGIIRTTQGNGFDKAVDSSYEQWISRLQVIFMAFAKEKPHYTQLRYLDETGQELVRIDTDGGIPRIIPQDRLQNKRGRYYFTDTMKLPGNSVFISPLDLNRERGEIEIPYKPVIRYATPIYDSEGRKKGIVIINVLADVFLEKLNEERGYAEEEVFLIDKDGFYLHHSDKAKEWGGPVDLNSGAKLALDYPSDITSLILSGKSGEISAVEDRAIVYHPIFIDPRNKKAFWVLLVSFPRDVFYAPVSHLRKVLMGAIISVAAVTMFIAILFARLFTKPIRNLIIATRKMAEGNLSVKANVATQDEIGDLAKSFNYMADNLQKISVSRGSLLEEIAERIKAEEEVKDSEERLKVIFENAPDGIFLYDLKGVFIDGNRASEEMIGYKREDLIGKNMAQAGIVPKGEIPRLLANLAKIAMGRSTGPDEFTLIRKNGSSIMIENRSYPVKIKGRALVLGIAHDITKRKSSEEKLRATLSELERFNKTMLGREGRVIELKGEVNRLTLELGRKKKYHTTGDRKDESNG